MFIGSDGKNGSKSLGDISLIVSMNSDEDAHMCEVSVDEENPSAVPVLSIFHPLLSDALHPPFCSPRVNDLILILLFPPLLHMLIGIPSASDSSRSRGEFPRSRRS